MIKIKSKYLFRFFSKFKPEVVGLKSSSDVVDVSLELDDDPSPVIVDVPVTSDVDPSEDEEEEVDDVVVSVSVEYALVFSDVVDP